MRYTIPFLICMSCSCWGAQHQLTRGESKEVVRKVSNYVIQEDNPHVEKALERTLTRNPNYRTMDLGEQRGRALETIKGVDQVVDENLRAELLKWAVQELSARNNHEVGVRQEEEKKKWVATAIAVLTSIATVVVPVIVKSYGCGD